MPTSTTASARPCFKTATPQFSVSNVVATAEYYRKTLGFEVRGFLGDPPVFATVGRDGVEIFFNQLPPGHATTRVAAYCSTTPARSLSATTFGSESREVGNRWTCRWLPNTRVKLTAPSWYRGHRFVKTSMSRRSLRAIR